MLLPTPTSSPLTYFYHLSVPFHSLSWLLCLLFDIGAAKLVTIEMHPLER